MSDEPKVKKIAEAADGLSLGISIVVAVLMGVGIGLLLRRYLGYEWLFWFGVALGISAAVLNVYKAYKKQKKSLDELVNDPRYKQRSFDDDDDWDDKY